MDTSLFRQQAIEEQKNRLFGDVLLQQPLSYKLITFSVFIAVSAIALLLFYGSYARRESVNGYLVPDKGLVKIYAPAKGMLEKLHIEEGQIVQKKDLLFTITTVQSNTEGSDRDGILLLELKQQKINLSQKIIQEELLKGLKSAAFEKQLKGIKKELEQLETAITLQEKQLLISSTRREKYKQLFRKGHLSETSYQESEQSYLSNNVRVKTSEQQKIQLENRSNSLRQQQIQLPIEWQSRLSDFDKNFSELEQRIIEISGRRAYSIRAPISGRLTALQISEGQTLNTQAPLIAILPEGTQLQADLFLPTRAAGFIDQGQKVLLRYAAFPYQHYGLQSGKVKNMAQIILSPNELPIPLALKEPVYRVRVALDQQTVAAYGKQLSLQAGMLLDADIVLEKRTLGQWLLAPIYELSGY